MLKGFHSPSYQKQKHLNPTNAGWTHTSGWPGNAPEKAWVEPRRHEMFASISTIGTAASTEHYAEPRVAFFYTTDEDLELHDAWRYQ